MLCPGCHGLHEVWAAEIKIDERGRKYLQRVRVACPQCGGYAVISCCEGHEAQPDGEFLGFT